MALASDDVDTSWPRRHRPAGRAAADDETETWTSLVEKHGSLAATASCLDLALDNRRRQADCRVRPRACGKLLVVVMVVLTWRKGQYCPNNCVNKVG